MKPSVQNIMDAIKPKPLIFGLTVRNIPTINLRGQYQHDKGILSVDNLDGLLHNWRFGKLASPISITYPDPDSYFTTIIRSTIAGIECTLQAAPIEELAFSQRLTEAHMSKDLGKSMVNTYYNRFPAKVNPAAALKIHGPALYSSVQQFYREIRNPLAHGFELADVNAESLRSVFGMFDDIYMWIDSWSDPNRVRRIVSSVAFKPLK